MRRFAILALLLIAPAQAQTGSQLVPQWNIDRTGPSRTISVRDPSSAGLQPIGSITPDGFQPAPVINSNPTLVAGAYGLPTDGLGSLTATRQRLNLTGSRTTPKFSQVIEVLDNQSGPASTATNPTPASASYGQGCSMQRPNWVTSSITGEMDCYSAVIRQANGDAAAYLGNVGGRNGFFAFSESVTYGFDAVGAITKGVNAQIGVVNTRDGGEYGLILNAITGTNLTSAIRVSNLGSSTWAWGYQAFNASGTQIAGIRMSDGAYIGGTVAPATDLGANVGGPNTRYNATYTQLMQMTELAAGSVATPVSGQQVLFLDTADHKLKRKDSTGTVTVIG